MGDYNVNTFRTVLTLVAFTSITQICLGQTSTTSGFTTGTPKAVLNNPNYANSGNLAGAVQTAVTWGNVPGTRGVKISAIQLIRRGNGSTIKDKSVPISNADATTGWTVDTPSGNFAETFYNLPSGTTVMFTMQLTDANSNLIGSTICSSKIVAP
jgi:hypothetical protein